MSLTLQALTKSFGQTKAVNQINLTINEGEFFTLLGPSGCGKTTILRLIAGIYQADQGRITLNGHDITNTPMHRRNISLMFQNYALFPHLTAAQNVAFGLRMRGTPRKEREARTHEALSLVHLDHLATRLPNQLSGGQQQRVALARALVVRPDLLLLDEPLSNLDARLRDELRQEIRDLQRRLRITTILVTHDIQEAFALSDRIALLRQGQVEQVGTPQHLYRHPKTLYAARLLGPTNELPIEGGTLILRPEHIHLNPAPGTVDRTVEATLRDVTFLGSRTQACLQIDNHVFRVELPILAPHTCTSTDSVTVGWQAANEYRIPDQNFGT